MMTDAQNYPKKRFDKTNLDVFSIKREVYDETDDENLVNASKIKIDSVNFLSGKMHIVYDPSNIPECIVYQCVSDLFLKSFFGVEKYFEKRFWL